MRSHSHAAGYFHAMPRRHDHDAAGPRTPARKPRGANRYGTMSEKRIARFPSPDGRIPNFVGAEAAADALAQTNEWERAETIKANPDAPQLPVRIRALHDGKLLPPKTDAVPPTVPPICMVDRSHADARVLWPCHRQRLAGERHPFLFTWSSTPQGSARGVPHFRLHSRNFGVCRVRKTGAQPSRSRRGKARFGLRTGRPRARGSYLFSFTQSASPGVVPVADVGTFFRVTGSPLSQPGPARRGTSRRCSVLRRSGPTSAWWLPRGC